MGIVNYGSMNSKVRKFYSPSPIFLLWLCEIPDKCYNVARGNPQSITMFPDGRGIYEF